MRFNLLTDDDAVSPVIGVILMVAITVILAAVIGAFVLGITGQQSMTPQGHWGVEAFDTTGNDTTDKVEFSYQTGDQIQRSHLAVSIPGNQTSLGDGTVTAGTRIVVELDETESGPAGNDLLVLWSEEGSDESAILIRHTFQSQYGDDFERVSVE